MQAVRAAVELGRADLDSAERTGSDLHLELSAPGSRRAVLMTALREAIRSGRLAPGTRLRPYRSLAVDLALARNAVCQRT